MNPSKRHHFIPEFILRSFTNEKGKFYIYLTKQDRFKSNERLFSPKQQFYENYANRTFIGKRESLFIEKEFSNIDNTVGSILHKCKSDVNYRSTEHEWVTLQHFVDLLFWRNPANEHLLKEKVKNAKSLSELGLSNSRRLLRQESTEHDKLDINEINSDEGIYKCIRLLMPMSNEIANKNHSMVY